MTRIAGPWWLVTAATWLPNTATNWNWNYHSDARSAKDRAMSKDLSEEGGSGLGKSKD